MTFAEEMAKFWKTFPKPRLKPAIETYRWYKDAIECKNSEAAQRLACSFLYLKPNRKDSKSDRRAKKELKKFLDDYDFDLVINLI